MIPTEMVQCHPPMPLPASSTPPDSPTLLPGVTLSDDQVAEMADAIAATKMALTALGNPPPSLVTETATAAPSSPTLCHTCLTSSVAQVAREFAQQAVEALKSINAKQGSPLVKLSNTATDTKSEEPKARASMLEFKKVNEVWDKREYKYKVVESLTSPDELTELDHYIFVVRTRIDKETQNQIHYIDVKSAGLRDVLRKILENAPGTCLHEEKPSVEQSLLYHYLTDLEECRQNPNVGLDRSTLGHLDLLLDFIRTIYASTTERLGQLLEKHQVTYNLLWTLFKPNTLVYTKCFGTGQPRYVRYEFREEKKTKDRVEYFYVKARYLDFDGRVFGETSSDHAIEKFRGSKQITALEVFPLKFHPDEKHLRAHLIECGRKFLSLMDIHLCEFEGKAFYIEKQQVVEIFIKSRVMVDAAYFREENPNYTRPSIKESNSPSWDMFDLDKIAEGLSSPAKNNRMDPSEVKGDDLLLQSNYSWV